MSSRSTGDGDRTDRKEPNTNSDDHSKQKKEIDTEGTSGRNKGKDTKSEDERTLNGANIKIETGIEEKSNGEIIDSDELYYGEVLEVIESEKRFIATIGKKGENGVRADFVFSDLRKEKYEKLLCEGLPIVFRIYNLIEYDDDGDRLNKKIYYVDVLDTSNELTEKEKENKEDIKNEIEEVFKKG